MLNNTFSQDICTFHSTSFQQKCTKKATCLYKLRLARKSGYLEFPDSLSALVKHTTWRDNLKTCNVTQFK